MADPYQYIDANGVIVPDTSNILGGVQAEYQAVFGTDLIVTPDTPQGLLITADAIARVETVNNNAAVANQLNPNEAVGVFLDAIAALTGIQRIAATQTVVPGVTLTGVANTTVPAGSQAKTAAGDIFSTLSTVVIGMGGSITVDFMAVEFGPIVCDANSLNQIISNVLGWETVNNSAAGVLGQNVQSDQALRAFRNNTLGFQGVALATAITSALYNVAGVQSLFFQENIAATTQTINGISMVAHSVYACVSGGSDLDVAAALLENKSSGSAWNGGTSISIVEPASGQTYDVLFDRPTPEPIVVRVTTSNGVMANIVQAVLDYAAGNIEGLQGFIVGGDISAFEIAGAIVGENPGYYISKVEISLASSISYQTTPIAIAVDQIATIDASSVFVVVSA